MSILPEFINNFNVYDNLNQTNKLIGISDEVKLPSFDSKTVTVSGAGLYGEIDSPVPGNFGSMVFNLPFKVLYKSAIPKISGNTVSLTLRGSVQTENSSLDISTDVPMVISVKGKVKNFDPGTVKVADAMNGSIDIELTYIYITVNSNDIVKLDKINAIYELRGVDMLKSIKSNC
jgi:hypothetical protein